MRRYKFFILPILVSVFYIGYMWYNQNKYIKLIKNDASLLKNYYNEYSMNYYDALPKKNNDIDKMIKWVQFNFDSSYYKKLNFEYNVKYDSILKRSIVYSLGKDKRDNHLKHKPFNGVKIDSLGQFSIFKLSIFDYIFNSSDHDIILGVFYEPIFKCELLGNPETPDEARVSQFELFMESKSLFGDKKYFPLFLKMLKDFENNYNASLTESGELNSLFFIYKREGIEIICDGNLEASKVANIKLKLTDFISNQNTSYFDYAVFGLELY